MVRQLFRPVVSARPSAFLAHLFAVMALLAGMAAAGMPVHAADGFRHQALDSDAARFENWLKANFKAEARAYRQNLASGQRLMKAGKELRAATRAFSQAVAAKPDGSEAWSGLAKSLLAIPEGQLSGSERYRLPVNASAAAYRAYQHAEGDERRADALVVLSQALQRRSFWRPAIDALNQSLALKDDGELRRQRDELVAAHGFCLLYTSDAADESSSV